MDATWNGTEYVQAVITSTVTPAEAPVNADATADVPSNYLICQRSGMRVSVAEGLKREWTGLLVRKESYEARNSQDFVRSVAEHQKGSPRPEQVDVFLTTNQIQPSDL